MSDPLGTALAGQFSPFVTSAGTVNAALDVLRFARQGVRGAVGAAGSPIDPLSPQTLVWVRNDTGGDLDARAVVALGEPTFDLTLDTLVHEARRNPTFPGTAPAAATDPFAVLIEPAGDGQYARAAVLGVVPVDLDVQDSGDTHASPESAVTDTLTTGTSGPAVIIWKESGTGSKRGAVLLTGQGGAASGSGITVVEADGSPSVSSVTTLRFDQADGFVVSTSGAGVARVDMTAANAAGVGIVTLGNQTLGSGIKTVDDLVANYTIYGPDVTGDDVVANTGMLSPLFDVDSGGTGYFVNSTVAIDGSGYFRPVSSTDGAAPNNSIYYSTTASKLVYKDSGGGVNNLY